VIKARAPELLRRALRLGLAAGAALAVVSTAQAQDAAPRVYVMPTSGIVDQVMQGYVHEGIAKAQREGAAAVLIELDTPGGDLNATNEIVKTLLEAPLPVIVWVGPGGARAASAGTYITLASNVAVMDPQARIGAATPIDSSGGDIPGALGAKILQDTEAQLRIITTARNRNYDWALTTVTESKAYTAQEALNAGGVDGIAASVNDAIAFANGRTTSVNGQQVTLNLAGATTQDIPMNPLQSLLHLLADPNIAFILFTLGFYGLLFELQNPNFVTGTLGALAIVLAFIGFGSLPLNLGGLLLMGIGIILFIVDLHVTQHGLPTIAGIVCFVLGAAALYTEPGTPTAPDVSVALPVLVTVTIATTSFMALVVVTAVRTRRMVTAAGLVGAGLATNALGEVRKPLTPIGSVYAGGEEWTARATDEQSLSRGTPVRVVRQEGLTLVVEPAENPASGG
jgi:membrane-bound serine protease (ClpP class)